MTAPGAGARVERVPVGLGGATLPGVSGRWSALALLGLLVMSAIAVPLAVHRALWIQAEAVIALWFVVWGVALTALGYAGRSVTQDWGVFRSTWDRLGAAIRGNREPAPAAGGGSGGTGWLDAPIGFGDAGDGCASLLVLIVVVVLIYVTVGWIIPLVAFTLYGLVRAMLNKVGDHAAETRGDLPAAVGRGLLWAGAYTAPLAAAVWLLHVSW